MLASRPGGLNTRMRNLAFFLDGLLWSWKSFKQECGRVSVGDRRQVFRLEAWRPGRRLRQHPRGERKGPL